VAVPRFGAVAAWTKDGKARPKTKTSTLIETLFDVFILYFITDL